MSTASNVVFFSPFAGIWLHALPEALVAAELRRAGANVTYVTCDGILAAGCTVMAAHGLASDADAGKRESICAKCRKQRDMILDALDVDSVSIDSLVDLPARSEIDQQVGAVTQQSMTDYTADGFPLGRYALHGTIIHYKLSDLSELTPAAFSHFQVDLKHVLFALHATRQMLQRLDPQRIVTYNTHFSLNFTMMNFAEREGVPVFGLHAGGNMAKRLSSLYVFRRDISALYRDMMRRFEEVLAGVPGDAAGIRDAADHFLALTSGRSIFVYSAPKRRDYFNVRRFFGIGASQKVVLATLSSYDELLSSQMTGLTPSTPLMFNSVVEWVQELISWARTRPDVFLIIRVHPREFPNRRDTVHSNHARQLAATFENLPDNVRINWPTDRISLYDLAAEVDVGLNGWSSAGKELSLLGIPVVLFTGDIIYYPASLNLLATSRADYFAAVERALVGGSACQRIRRTFRWLSIEYALSTIDISDGFTFTEGARPSLARRALNRLMRSFDPFRAHRSELRALRRPLRQGRKFVRAILDGVPVVDLQLEDRVPLSDSEERRLVGAELRRILEHAYAATPASTPLQQRLRTVLLGLEEARAA